LSDGPATALARRLEAELATLGTSERARKEKAYLKSELAHLGVTVPEIRALAREAKREAKLDHDGLVALVTALWAREIHELRALAVMFLDAHPKLLGPGDVPLLERFLRESKTWALVDELAVHVVGGLVARAPDELASVLDRWASDGDFWIRRASMLALLRPLREGGGDFARFGRYADRMLEEKEFFIRKAIGWVLRETSKRRPELVIEWLEPRAARASGITLREAMKYLPEDARARIVSAAQKKSP
jgi:3-methyladenine DNA glycosylase AlkD